MEPTKKNPSFSSSLLDAIYRSIDEDDGGADHHRRPRNGVRNPVIAEKVDFASSNRRCFTSITTGTKKLTATTAVINNNRSNDVLGKVVLGRCQHGGASESERRRQNYRRELQLQKQQRERHVTNSSSSSSESSYGGFSSSEAESVRMVPTRTAAGRPAKASETRNPRPETGTSIKSRFQASKIYGELKKARGSVSPGGRLASFINHLFNSSVGLSKLKNPSPAVRGDQPTWSSTSYSRSCLSKAASSSRPDGGAKRSVRFYPATVFAGDDLRSCGSKSINRDSVHLSDPFDLSSLPPLPPVRVKTTPVTMAFADDDDDAASYSSSDLFELENLTSAGADELPVYETTRLDTNRAIARGLIM